MKTLIFGTILLTSAISFSDSKVTTKINKGINVDGKAFTIKRTFRNDKELLRELFLKESGQPNQRIFFIDDKIKIYEEDKDYDGFYETFRIYKNNTLSDFESFKRSKDGSVKPFTSDENKKLIERVKKETSDAEAVLEAMSGDISPETKEEQKK